MGRVHLIKRNSLERVNERVVRDINIDHHYIPGRKAMNLRVDISLVTMTTPTVCVIEAGNPKQMRSLVLPRAT